MIDWRFDLPFLYYFIYVALCHAKDIRELKQRRFWATHVNRKWGLLPFYMPGHYQICIAEFLFSYKDDLSKGFNQTTAQCCKKSTSVDVRRSKTLSPNLFNEVQISPGGDSHMKQTGMLVVSLRGVNFGFCSGQSANILSRQGLV